MKSRYQYKDLDKHFIRRETISPFYSHNIKLPRKLKKKVKKWCGIYWPHISTGQALWYYMECSNPDYKTFLIKQICDVE